MRRIYLRQNTLSTIGNVLLFISSLLLLIDISPRDLLPSYQRQQGAISELKDKHFIYALPSQGINFNFQGQQAYADPQAYKILKELIIENSALVSEVDWDRAVGIGYAADKIPVAQGELEFLRPLFVAQLPKSQDTMLLLVPVGQLSDLDTWLRAKHRGSLTFAATVSLFFGFLMQLIAGFLHKDQVPSQNLGQNNQGLSLTP